MSKDIKLEKLLQNAESVEIPNFEAKSLTTNIYSRVVELIKAKTEVELRKNVKYEFTPRMMYKIFDENNSKYFADLFWTHSDNPKNLKANPKNEILFHSPRRSVYHLIVKSTKKSEIKSEVKTS